MKRMILALMCAMVFLSPVAATDRPWRVVWQNRDLTVNPLSEVAVDNQGFDLGAYARARYGPTAVAVLVNNHAYGWRIRYTAGNQKREVGIDMLDVASWHGAQMYGNRVKNAGVYFTNWGPYSWRGTYILRGVR